MTGKVGSMSPCLQIGRSEESNNELLRIRNNSDPQITILDDLGVSELSGSRAQRQNWVSRVLLKCVTTIDRPSEILSLSSWCVGCVDCNHAIVLVREEPRCVVCIDDYTTREDLWVLGCVDGDLLVIPVVQILGSCVSPVLVSCNDICWVVCRESVADFKKWKDKASIHW